MTNSTDQADRELDQVIAEKVMGLIPCDQWTKTNFGSAGGPALLKNCQHEHCYPTLEIGSIHGTIGGCPPYSAKITAAWEIVRQMQSLGYELRLESGGNGAEWTVKFRPANSSDTTINNRVSNKSAETAICLAALQALATDN